MIQYRLQQIADEFWIRAGCTEPFPRMLEDALLWAFPLSVTKLSGLDTQNVENWLRKRGIDLPLAHRNRNLHACVVAFRGSGLIFLDSNDEVSERRFSIAHEIGHFLLDYWEPRQKAVSRFGPSIQDVIDGIRPATVEERANSVLADVRIKPFTHLMERKPHGQLGCARLQGAEQRADTLALELLAPYETVKKHLNERLEHTNEWTASAQQILTRDFGLPSQIAFIYIKTFEREKKDGPTIREWLAY